ncbi:MAG: hypothetical protein WD423_07840 [Rhodothermales bacterium]
MIILATGTHDVHAQSLGSNTGTNLQVSEGAYYRLAEPGDVVIRVTVWGEIRTGIYEVTRGIHLSTLFTLAGGSVTRTINPREDQELRIRIVRRHGGRHSVAYEYTMTESTLVFEEDPILEDGDVLIVQGVEQRRLFTWREVLSVVTAVSSSVYLVSQVVRLWRN